ncbi:MAG TPA: hypothetical protein VFK05_07650 [Polyangiaceae bacterium]|nr:hypothetical protein [Polyangiaceae bacterium]
MRAYLTCFGNESAECVRVTAADSFCMNVSLPTAYSCVSTSPQKAGCEQTVGAYYCPK